MEVATVYYYINCTFLYSPFKVLVFKARDSFSEYSQIGGQRNYIEYFHLLLNARLSYSYLSAILKLIVDFLKCLSLTSSLSP